MVTRTLELINTTRTILRLLVACAIRIVSMVLLLLPLHRPVIIANLSVQIPNIATLVAFWFVLF